MKQSLYILLLLMLASWAVADPTISAILYDPDGADSGKEWIELYNPTNHTINLNNYSIEFGNGATADNWNTIWTSTQQIPPQSYFLIGEMSNADQSTSLSIQNGPDAIRLKSNNTVLETVGWGAHTFAEYYETTSFTNTTSGEALVRIASTLNNANDFISAIHEPRYRTYQQINPIQKNVTYTIKVNSNPTIHTITLLNDNLHIINRTHLQVQLNVSEIEDNLTIDLIYNNTIITQTEQEILFEDTLVNNTDLYLESTSPFGEYQIKVENKTYNFTINKTIGVDTSTLINFTQVNESWYIGYVNITNSGNSKFDLSVNLQNEIFEQVVFAYENESIQVNDETSIRQIGPTQTIWAQIYVKPSVRRGTFTGVFEVIAQ